jgi:hypothetical protein
MEIETMEHEVTMNRRAMLGRLAAAGVVVAAPSVALAAHSDAALFALQGQIDAADRELDATLDALSHAQERFYEIRRERGEAPSPPADPEWDQILASFSAQMKEYRAREPRPEMLAYNEAMKLREMAESEAQTESGLDAAEAAEDAASGAVTELRDRIVAAPAKTLAGLSMTTIRTSWIRSLMTCSQWAERRRGPEGLAETQGSFSSS